MRVIRAALAAGSLVTAAVAASNPDWALRLADAGYYGYGEPPQAVDDAFLLDEGGFLAVVAAEHSVLANDSDADGDTLSVSALLQAPEHHVGDFVLNADGSFDYQHDGSETTQDRFVYQISDGEHTAQAEAVLGIVPVDDRPMAMAIAFTVDEDTPALLPVMGNDVDVDGGPAMIVGLAQSAHGQAEIAEDGTAVNYAAHADYCGLDEFAYTLNGGSEATVSIQVSCINDPPSFAHLGDVTIPPGGAGVRDIPAWASHFDAGPGETDQIDSYLVEVVSDPDGLIEDAAVSVDGQLSLHLTGRGGSASLEVAVRDDGGGDDTSAPQTFLVQVEAGTDLFIAVDNHREGVVADLEVIYEVIVSNRGPNDAPDVNLSLEATPHLSELGWLCVESGAESTCTESGDGLLSDQVFLARDEQLVYLLMGLVSGSEAGPVTLSATVAPSDVVTELSPEDNSDEDSDKLLGDAVFRDGFEATTLSRRGL